MIKKLFLFAIIYISAIGYTKAQISIDYDNPQEYIIQKISITGVKYSSTKTLVQISGLEEGQKITVPGQDIADAVKNLWKQKMFSDVQIYATKIEGDKIWLEIFLQEHSRLTKMNYHGIRRYHKEDITDLIGLTRGTQITDDIIKRSEGLIKGFYAEKGFSKTRVKIYKSVDTTFINGVILDVFVSKNRKTRIENIFLEGNKVVKGRKIRWKFLKETKPRRWYGLFKPSKYIKSKYEDDKINLINEYNKLGYRDAQIVSDSVWDATPKNVNIKIKIEEGKRYYFRDIKWIGNKKYKTEVLQALLRIKKGDVYNKEKLLNRLNVDEDAVGNIYTDNGYLFFNVRPVEIRIENDSVDIELRVYEGEKAKVNKIIITGNDRTNDHVIRREIRTKPGDWFSKRDIIRTVRELAQLGHFDPEQIIPTPEPNQANGTVDIRYSLVERGNDRFEISGGYGGNMIIGSVGLSFNNFSIQNIFDKSAWRPLPTGDGQQFSIRAQTRGVIQQYYSLSFVEPWLGGKKPISLTVSGYYSRQSYAWTNEQALLRNIQVLGGVVGIGRRLKFPDDYFTLYNEFGFQKYILTNWEIISGFDNGSFNNFSFKTVFGRNSISQPIYPRSGSSFSIGLELTPPYSLLNGKDYTQLPTEEKYKWLEYNKWTFKSSWFSKLVGDLVLNTKVEFGYLNYYNADVGYSPFGGFSLGGSGMSYYSYGTDIVGLRGYKDGALKPTKGGNLYTKYVIELRYPAIQSQSTTIYGLAFVDAGNSWYEFKKFNPFNIYRSAGLGARIFLPMLGMIGFDWGYGFDKLPGQTEPNGSEFHFTMGQQF